MPPSNLARLGLLLLLSLIIAACGGGAAPGQSPSATAASAPGGQTSSTPGQDGAKPTAAATVTRDTPPADPTVRLTEDPDTAEQWIVIESPTEGAAIHYTLDGSEPGPDSGELYTGPISVSSTTAVRAVATLSTAGPSGITDAWFPQVDPPSHGSGGVFACNHDLPLNGSSDGAPVRYTTDGRAPSAAVGEVSTGTVRVTESGTVKAQAFQEGAVNSAVVGIPVEIERVLIDPPRPSLDGGVYVGPQTLSFGSPDANGTIWYTTDGSDPAPGDALVYDGPIQLTSPVTIKSVAHSDGCQTSDAREDTYRVYAHAVTNDEPIVLRGNDVLEIVDTYYIHRNDITLEDNSSLVIKDSLLVHEKDHAFQYGLQARDNSSVTVVNSGIGNQCTGSLNWSFYDRSSFTADHVRHVEGCNTWHLFTDDATATINDWEFFGGTTCERADVTVNASPRVELELCFAAGSVVDEALPVEIGEFSFPNADESGIDWSLTVRDSTIEGWGVGVPPQSHITIRDAAAATVSVIVGFPWENETVVLEGLGSKLYEDQTWEIVDSTLRLVNVSTYGWEPNVFGNNSLVIKDSDFSGSNIGGGDTQLTVQNSTMGTMATQERMDMPIEDSVVRGDVIAADDSTMTLVNTVVGAQPAPGEENQTVFGNLFAKDNAKVVLINTTIQGETTIEGNGSVETR